VLIERINNIVVLIFLMPYLVAGWVSLNNQPGICRVFFTPTEVWFEDLNIRRAAFFTPARSSAARSPPPARPHHAAQHIRTL
jgi:hypothetical protein